MIIFTGQELDPATGLYYYDARWYGPHLGQFVSRDSVVSADANPYRYVRGSPVNFADPSGHGPCGQPVWDAELGRYVDPLYEQWAAEARARQRPVHRSSTEPGFWQGYWYYLWNPSKMDADLRTAQKVALGTAAVAGGGAAGLAAGGAATTWLAAGGATTGKAAFAGGMVGSTVGSTTGYAIGRPLGEDVAAVGAVGGGLIGGFAPAMASAARSTPIAAGRGRVPWEYGNSGGALGTTDKFGNITIQPGLTGRVLDETVRHEAVHRFFSPSPGIVGNVRAELGMASYRHSHLIRYLEEGIAETFATGSLKQGLAYPINAGYVSGSRVFVEGVGYVTITAGGVYVGYTIGSKGGQ